jgi:hypothetical protein
LKWKKERKDSVIQRNIEQNLLRNLPCRISVDENAFTTYAIEFLNQYYRYGADGSKFSSKMKLNLLSINAPLNYIMG